MCRRMQIAQPVDVAIGDSCFNPIAIGHENIGCKHRKSKEKRIKKGFGRQR